MALRHFSFAAAAAALFFGSGAALARDAVVSRDVTLRAEPSRRSEAIAFPAPGTRVELLDGGAARGGYYHVRLPDGRTGWIQRSFLRLDGEAEAAAGAPAPGTYRVSAIDVGTGLAVLVEGADFTLLYDAGSNDDDARGERNRVIAYLKARRPDLARIDHLVLSHPHKDHSELMPDLLAAYAVANVWDSGSVNPICSYRLLLEATAAEPGAVYHHDGAPGPHSVGFGAKTCYGRAVPAATVTIASAVPIDAAPVPLGAGATMEVLHADGSRTADFNEASVVVRLDLGTRRLLLPGDGEAGGRRPPTDAPAPNSVEGQLLATHRADLRADILVAGHHGSKTSSRTAFLDAVGASQYIVSAGPKKYATVTLPDAEVVAELSRRGTVWRTDVDDAACAVRTAKIGPDADGKPGGCDTVVILIGPGGALSPGYDRRPD